MSPSDPAAPDPRAGGPSGPSPEEVAAIVAAVDAVLSQPVVVMDAPERDATPPWRFSGRWWTRPVAARRDRPW